MRRISLALALAGAVAAAGCGGAGNTGSNPTGSTGDKGVAQGTFTVTIQNGQNSPTGNDTLKIKGGRVVSTPAGIDCGVTIDAATQAAVAHEACSAPFAAGTPVTLDAQAATTIDRGYDANYAFRGWAGDCAGLTNPCTVADAANKADRYVVASFAGGMTGHPNYTDPAVHGPLAAPSCASCHGSNFQGQGLALGCNQCHNASGTVGGAATGLVVSNLSLSTAAPVTATFQLADKTGAYVDVTGLNSTYPGSRWSASKNRPVPVTLALSFFGTDTNGNVLPYKSATNGNPATTSAFAAVTSMTLGGSTATVVPNGLYPEGTYARNGVVCTAAATCSCTTASPCQYTGTVGSQAGRRCTPSNPCVCTSANPCAPPLNAAPTAGGLSFNPATGVYTYTFSGTVLPASGSTLENGTLWLATYRQENLLSNYDAKRYTAVNADHNFRVFDTAAAVARRITDEASCAKCHDGFPAEANATGTGWGGFHSGARINTGYCNICHYDARRANALDGGADSKSFVHRIHSAEHAGAPTTAWYHNTAGVNGIAVTYPQDPRNCRECHPDTAQGNQYRTRPTRAACVGCHYNVWFAASTATDPLASTSVAHAGGRGVVDGVDFTSDASCGTADCHTSSNIDRFHIPVIGPDAGSALHANLTGGNTRTNASSMVAAGSPSLPTGAHRLTAEVASVTAWADAGGVSRPRMTFRILNDGVPVTFNPAPATPATGAELITGFTGSTTAYFAWSVPQDGIGTPADFNVTASANLKVVWLGTDSGTSAADLSAPDASGFYTITLTGVQLASNAQYLTGGIGYAYDLPAAQPFTQTDLPDFPVEAVSSTTGTLLGVACTVADPCTFQRGGLVVPIQNVWKSATGTGWLPRRTIVSNDRCNNCHGFLGVAPNFHVGQRNDGPTCSFCHNPNRTSSGWSANSKDFIHGIHGAKWRTQGFNWHSGSCPTGTTFVQNAATAANPNGGTCQTAAGAVVTPSPWYPGVEFPGSRCTDCHEPGTYDFSAPASAAAVANLLPSTAATGTLSASISTSPYVPLGTSTGSGFKYAADTGVTTVATGASLVISPITAACFSCHDSAASVAHFRANGGKVYAPRSGGSFLAENEACLSCHGPTGMAPIGKVHR